AASDVTLSIATNCPCESDRDVDVSIVAMRMGAPAAGVPLELRAVRSPHIFAPGSLPETVRWATTLVLERTIRTDSAGHARFALPTPTDGLASTYGLSATTAGASASARVTVATAPFALAIEPDLSDIDVGEPAGFEVRGFDADDGSAKAAMPVTVRLAHGTAVQTKSVTLDERGRAHVVFNAPSLGSSIATAEASAAGVRALDATSITVAPIGGSAGNAASEPDVTVTLDRTSYRPGERLNVRARLDGTTGDALMTIDGARTYQARLGTVGAAGAQAALDLGDPQGEARATATLVRDGALVGGSERITIDGPGHLGAMSLTLDRPPNGGPARVEIHDGGLGGGTVAVSVTDGRPSEGASFEDAPGVLLGGGTTEQRNAPPSPAWHTFVTPARSRASDIYAAERPRKTLPELPPIGAATPRTRYWSVTRTNSHEVQVPVPAERGSYLISVLKIADDGDVGTASVAFTVR
ncbi:MAG TPA: hypothetical protein VKG44_02530, partial [Candidatus Baltobacteraceae bacterium]|nr:hypothetical protein [Candidatus Baltobacteraceae bacterium]